MFSSCSFAGSALTAGRVSRACSMTMEAQGAMYETMDSMEKEVAPAGGGFWFGSAGFWGEEDYRGFVDSYKPDNLINVRAVVFWRGGFRRTVFNSNSRRRVCWEDCFRKEFEMHPKCTTRRYAKNKYGREGNTFARDKARKMRV